MRDGTGARRGLVSGTGALERRGRWCVVGGAGIEMFRDWGVDRGRGDDGCNGC